MHPAGDQGSRKAHQAGILLTDHNEQHMERQRLISKFVYFSHVFVLLPIR